MYGPTAAKLQLIDLPRKITYEELISGKPEWRMLLQEVDVLVDGRFEKAKRTLELRFRGSSNQRLIDVQASLREEKFIEFSLE